MPAAEKGKRGKIIAIHSKKDLGHCGGRAAMIKKHMRKSQDSPQGAIDIRAAEGTLHISNVMKAEGL